jgi:hypothetical protein
MDFLDCDTDLTSNVVSTHRLLGLKGQIEDGKITVATFSAMMTGGTVASSAALPLVKENIAAKIAQ